MARRVSRRTHQQVLMDTWWVRAIITFVALLTAYGFASLAIDSGSLFEYAAAIACIWYAFHNGIRAVRLVFS